MLYRPSLITDIEALEETERALQFIDLNVLIRVLTLTMSHANTTGRALHWGSIRKYVNAIIRMDAAKLVLLQELELEDSNVERNSDLYGAIKQPLAYMVSGGYSCDVNDDGAEIFSNGKVEVTVPKSCVKWLKQPKQPDGPTEMPVERQQLLWALRIERCRAPPQVLYGTGVSGNSR